jgi:hypothetical protein
MKKQRDAIGFPSTQLAKYPPKIKGTSLYDTNLCMELLNYFSDPDIHPIPLFEGFAAHLGVSTQTLKAWAKAHPEFASAVERAIDIQRLKWIEASLAGTVQGPFTIFAGSNLFGWSNKTQAAVTGANDEPLKITVQWKAPDARD